MKKMLLIIGLQFLLLAGQSQTNDPWIQSNSTPGIAAGFTPLPAAGEPDPVEILTGIPSAVSTGNLPVSHFSIAGWTGVDLAAPKDLGWAAPPNDNSANATDVTALIDASCTTGGSYTNTGATADHSAGSCWSGGPYGNVWYKFTASATGFINVQVKVNGAGETMRYPMLALWNAGLSSQLQCQNQQGYGNGNANLSMSYYGLTPGAVYYIEVDNFAPWGTTGTFDLCLSDVVDYDYPQGAVDLTAQIDAGCSTGGTYSNQYATPDHSAGSCWSGGPYNNRWFKFTATSTTFINVQVKVGGAGETMRYPMVALWNATLSTQVQCQNQQGYGNGASSLSMSYYGLTPGAVYYIEVDNFTPWGSTGGFDLCLSDVPDYDYPQGAVDLTAQIDAGCSTGGTYSNQYATSDHSAGSCWSGGPYNNRWFKFTATATTFINVQVKVNGTGETMRYPMVALWNATLSSQVQCQNQQGYGNGSSNLSMSYYGLTPGAVYYIEVDNFTPWGTTGTFDVCLSDVVDYDYPQGAVDLTAQIDAGCSTGGTYSNQYATPDHSAGSCWSGGPFNNRWFKFTATSTTFINVQVKVSGTGETMRYPMVALWNATLSTQVQCQNQQGYGNGSTNLSMSYYGLTPGAVYYIEVDNFTSWGSTGTFDLCLSDVPDYDYPQGAVDLTAQIDASCSTSGTYSNQYATPDHSAGSCWSGGPYNNRWFKFTAGSSTFINVQVKVNSTGETMRYPMVALWNATLTTQVQCQNQQGYGNGSSNLSMSYYGLTPGAVYYIEVDNFTPWGSTGTFDVCLTDIPDYDYPQGAVDLTNSMNGCSTGGTYSNQYATPDHSAGSCWSGGPYNNRWFKFTASSSTFINVQVKVGLTGETMRYPMLALWNSSLTTQLQCQNQQGYGNGASSLSMSYYGLTPGAVYYIEVDNFTPWGSTGTFDICVSNQPDYDYPQGADVLTNLNNYCTSGGTYSNVTATPDHSAGSCWSGGPYNNRWFKFQAVNSTVTTTVEVSGAGETMRYPMIALWNSTYTTQLACVNQAGYGSGASNRTLTYSGLTVGNWYYIEVDNYTPWGSTGTFDLCINNNTANQYYSIATGDWSNPSNWSTTGFTGPVAGTIPSTGNIVNIQDQTITVSSPQNCQQINMTVSTASTGLVINNAQLTVYGTYNQTNGGSNNDIITMVENAGTLAVNDNASFTRNGGANNFQLNIDNGSSMTVGQDMLWTSTAGTVQTSQMNLNGTASLAITRDLTLSSTGGMQILHSLNNTSTVTVGRDLSFSANAAGLAQLALNNSSSLSLARNLVRTISAYGILNCGSSASLIFNGTANTQNLLGSAGTGGDAFTYSNVVINNTSGYSPSILVTGPASINGLLTLTSGLVFTSPANLLTLTPTASTSAGSSASASYIDGPLTIQKNTTGGSTLNFPIGKNQDCRPIVLTVNHSTNSLYNYQAEVFDASAVALNYTLPPTVNLVSQIHYYTIARTDAASTSQPVLDLSGNQTIQVFFGQNDGVTDGGNLTIVKNTYLNPTSWIDIGGIGAPPYVGGGNLTGSVTSTSAPVAFNSFSTFSLGNRLSGINILPIGLLYFKAIAGSNSVNLSWATATESNSHYFTIERSQDGVHFTPLQRVSSEALNGNSALPLYYSAEDASPLSGTSYYRLSLTSLSGTVAYSNIVSVNFSPTGNPAFILYPNPTEARQATYLEVSGLKPNTAILVSIYDLLGTRVFGQAFTIETAGSSKLTINPYALLHAGMFVVLVNDAVTGNVLYRQKLLIH